MTKKGADLTTFGQEKKGADLTKKGADLTNSLILGWLAVQFKTSNNNSDKKRYPTEASKNFTCLRKQL